MAKLRKLAFLLGVTLSSFGCSSAYADRVGRPPLRQVDRAESPYRLELIGEDGSVLPTFFHAGRFYVLGDVGDRYILRVTNPTPRRVEAVLSVDGLDVIDGRPADLGKRGYVVPPNGEVRIEGFRTSTADVATFRFSSVSGSYAGRKGLARNVGVIGVAFFEERAQPQVIVPEPVPYDYEDDIDEEPVARHHGGGEARRAPRPADKAPATADARGSDGGERERAEAPPAEPSPAPPPPRTVPGRGPSADAPRGGATANITSRGETGSDERCCTEPKPAKERSGLGTEFGERRTSMVTWTRFERRNPARPDAVAELRYNDADGLVALGIHIRPPVDRGEVETRETANPFPGSRFADPPPGL